MERLPEEVVEELGWYVYRLIDPRNGETFYVGKGKGQRIYQHVMGALKASGDEDDLNLKTRRIRQIQATGLTVGHVIHRFNIDSEAIAFEVEAAVIDAYPGLTNTVGGHGSNDYGCRHIKQIIDDFRREDFVADEPLILISIGQTYEERQDTYAAVRCAWAMSQSRAEAHKLVLAHRRGIVVGAFRPRQWLSATTTNFPSLPEDMTGRIGFVGDAAEKTAQDRYVGKRVPADLRRRGAANPVRYVASAN